MVMVIVTIKDIAKATGFSVTTVSRALNDFDDVKASTKQTIRQVADNLGYSPNILAKALVGQDTKTFGFITANFSTTTLMDNFSFKLYMGCVERANEMGYEVVLIHYNAKLYQNKSFAQIINERNLSGAIIQGFDTEDPFCYAALTSDIPTVFIDIGIENETSTYVMSDIRQAARTGLDYLMARGYSNCCFVRGSMRSFVTRVWLDEVQTFVADHRAQLPQFEILDGDYNQDKAFHNAQTLIAQNENINAFFCSSDVMAIGVMKAVKHLGKRIPEDIAVLGFDNIIVSEYISPGLTTIMQYPDRIGGGAITQLLKLLNHEQVKPLLLDTALVERASVGQR